MSEHAVFTVEVSGQPVPVPFSEVMEEFRIQLNHDMLTPNVHGHLDPARAITLLDFNVISVLFRHYEGQVRAALEARILAQDTQARELKKCQTNPS